MGTPQREDVEPERRKHFSMEGVVTGVKSADGSTRHDRGVAGDLESCFGGVPETELQHSVLITLEVFLGREEKMGETLGLFLFFLLFGLWDLSSLTRD